MSTLNVNRLVIASAILKAILSASSRLITSPFKGSNGSNTYFKDVVLASVRTQLGNLDLAADRYMTVPTTTSYLKYATDHKFKPESITLPSGAQAHWFGSPSAKKVLVYYHGGGYVQPCSPGHMLWLDDLQKSLGPNISALVLSYHLAPEHPYPAQLIQAVELLRYLVEAEGRSPSDLILGGDSAGGNLTLGVLSHIAHPHPEIQPLTLPSKIHGIMLISPWCALTNTTFLGSDSPFAGDFYNEPVLAAPEWWEPVADIVDEALIWIGGNEVLRDGIEAFAAKFTKGFGRKGGRVITAITPKACHDEMIVERILGYKGDSGTGSHQVVEEWVRLQAKL